MYGRVSESMKSYRTILSPIKGAKHGKAIEVYNKVKVKING